MTCLAHAPLMHCALSMRGDCSHVVMQVLLTIFLTQWHLARCTLSWLIKVRSSKDANSVYKNFELNFVLRYCIGFHALNLIGIWFVSTSVLSIDLCLDRSTTDPFLARTLFACEAWTLIGMCKGILVNVTITSSAGSQ